MKPQSADILLMLQHAPSGITSKDALEIGCSRLAARIADLRADGIAIDAELITVRSGERNVRVAKYRLRDAPRQLALSL